MESIRHTCLKLKIPSNIKPNDSDSIFVKGTWFQHRFDLSITDGLNAWICQATEDEVRARAAQWDQEASDYVTLAERYLGFQQPGSLYGFTDAGNGEKRVSWTFDKEGMKLEWRWKCQPASNSKKETAGILDFLMDANIKLSEEVVRKTQSFERVKVESEKCLAQSEKISEEKVKFETEVYAKFLHVLNAKKAKLREYRDQLSKQTTGGKQKQEEEHSSDKTETFDEDSEVEKTDEESESIVGTSKQVADRPRGRRKIARR